MVFIPYAREYTVTTTGTVVKLVECESCKGEYVYQLTRRGAGTGTSMLFLDDAGAQQRAEHEARAALLEKLSLDCDPVPCPFCGWYQRDMVERVRRLRHRWLITAGWLLVPIGLVFALVAAFFTQHPAADQHTTEIALFWALAALCVVGSPALIVWRYRSARKHDPNTEDVEKRKALGAHRAMSKVDFLRWQAQQNG
jgi:hypothetical protein